MSAALDEILPDRILTVTQNGWLFFCGLKSEILLKNARRFGKVTGRQRLAYLFTPKSKVKSRQSPKSTLDFGENDKNTDLSRGDDKREVKS